MYEIRFASAKVQKKCKKLLKRLSPTVKHRFKTTLENYPYPSSTHGSELCKIEKKGSVFCYEITGGDRILFDIYEAKKVVMIVMAGNDNEEIAWLKSHK
ncbi:MAG: hypothetical protein ACOY3M_03975 [Patescibacteria group bacterium]